MAFDMSPEQYGLLAAGLGMMGQRGSFGQAVGHGGLLGMNAMASARQAQLEDALRQQQIQQAQYQMAKARKQDDREEEFMRIAPGLDFSDRNAVGKALANAGHYEDATKLLAKNFGSGGDYQFIAGPDGKVMVGDKNAGKLSWGQIEGQPAVMGVYDPTTKANVKRAEQDNTYGDYVTPSGATMPMLKGQVAPQRKQFEFSDPQSLSDFVNSPEGKAVISQPAIGTAGDKQYAEEKGKSRAELEKADANIAKMAERQASLLADAELLLPNATNGGAQALLNDANKFFGRSTDATKADQQLEKIANDLTSAIPKAPGSQSDKELAFAQAQAGKLGDRSIPTGDRMAALKYLQKRQQYLSKGYGNAADVLMQQNNQLSVDDLVKKYTAGK